MNKMVDMKVPPPKKGDKDMMGEPVQMTRDQYPWGLKLTVETEQLSKLPDLEKYDAGDYVTLLVKCCVTRVELDKEIRDGKPKTRNRVELQIEKMLVNPTGNGKDKPLEAMSMKETRRQGSNMDEKQDTDYDKDVLIEAMTTKMVQASELIDDQARQILGLMSEVKRLTALFEEMQRFNGRIPIIH